jgi:Ser/Thr protein kinase RdoA (MazF antagonist)
MNAIRELTDARQLTVLNETAVQALAHYELPRKVDVKLVNRSENATFKIAAPDGRCWALRIHRDGYHSMTAIASELSWLTALRTAGVAVTPNPVKGRNDKLIQHVTHHASNQPRHVVLFDWETGSEPGIGQDLSDHFKTLGELAARMHVHARHWQQPKWFTRLTWDVETSLGEANPNWGRWRDGLGVDHTKATLFGRTVDLIHKRLAAYGKGRDRFGLTHCDMRLANLLFEGNTVKVIDFDDCGFSWYMYDAATPVSFYEHEPQVPQLIEHWKAGYRRVTALSEHDEAEIPTFVMLRRLLLVAWIGSHQETELAQSMGTRYTEGTTTLCEDYLHTFC